MTYIEALQAAKTGKRITRPSWGDHYAKIVQLSSRDKEDEFYWVIVKPGIGNMEWGPTGSDLNQRDYLITN